MRWGTSLFGGRELHIQSCGIAYLLQTRSSISSRGMGKFLQHENFEKIRDEKDFGLRHNENGRDRPTTANSQCVYASCETMHTTAQMFYLRNWGKGHLLSN